MVPLPDSEPRPAPGKVPRRVKRLIVLLVLLAGGLVAAAFAVPTNAAVVNGASVSQQQLNSDVHAIAGSPDYQCYLNSQEYLSSQGSEALPPVTGAGTGQNAGDNPTATSAFVSNYLDTEIGHQVVDQLATKQGVTVTQAQLTTARKAYEAQISAVMSEVAQTAQGQNPAFSCSTTGQALTGTEILDTLPASFVDQQVEFLATATRCRRTSRATGRATRSWSGTSRLISRTSTPRASRSLCSRRRATRRRPRRRWRRAPRSPPWLRAPRAVGPTGAWYWRT